MQSGNVEPASAQLRIEGESQSKKPRFRIEKLEERIAPAKWRSYPPGYYRNHGHGRGGSGGHCGHGACK